MPKQNKPRYHVTFHLDKETIELDFHDKKVMEHKLRNTLVGGGLHLNQGTAEETIYPAHMIRKIVVRDVELKKKEEEK